VKPGIEQRLKPAGSGVIAVNCANIIPGHSKFIDSCKEYNQSGVNEFQ
jgi:hypothetical protein